MFIHYSSFPPKTAIITAGVEHDEIIEKECLKYVAVNDRAIQAQNNVYTMMDYQLCLKSEVIY